MSIRSKKADVLRLLNDEAYPSSLREILKKLGEGSDRSVRRWLAEMVREGLVERVGNKRSTKYRAVSGQAEPTHLLFSPESERLIAQIRRPIYERNPITYVDQWIESYIPNDSFSFIFQKNGERLSIWQEGA
jgi:DNA-binding transcriptional ArsR family regulator